MFTRLAILLAATVLANAGPIQSTPVGIFTATGNSSWGNMSFQASSFTIPEAGSLDIILGTFSDRAAPGLVIAGGAPDFALMLDLPGGASHIFLYDISGVVFNFFGWRGWYDVISFDTGIIPLSYTTDDGTGSFNLQLRGLSNPAFRGLVQVGPGGTSDVGARITDATFTPNLVHAPEPASYVMLGGALVLLGVLRRRRT